MDSQSGQERGEATSVRDDAKDLVGLLVSEVNLKSGVSDHTEWVLDTGCTFHMAPRRDIFLSLKEMSSGKVQMVNNSVSKIKGIGLVRFDNQDGTTFFLYDVRFMPEISRNLISLGSLKDKDCKFKGSNGVLKVIKGCIVFMKGIRRQSLYILQGEARMSKSNAVDADTEKSVLSQDQTMM